MEDAERWEEGRQEKKAFSEWTEEAAQAGTRWREKRERWEEGEGERKGMWRYRTSDWSEHELQLSVEKSSRHWPMASDQRHFPGEVVGTFHGPSSGREKEKSTK